MVQNMQGEPLCSVPPHKDSVLPMTQNESDGEEKITAHNSSLRNKWQPVIWSKKAALLITVTQELAILHSSKNRQNVEQAFLSKGVV